MKMASKISSNGAVLNVVKRGYAQAAPQKATSFILPKHDPEVTALPSGTVIASHENNSPVSKIAVMFKAGSRYETVSNAGVSHVLRKAVGLGTANMTSFGIIRNSQQNGASISVDAGKEHIAYSLDIIRDQIDIGLNILSEVSVRPAFKPWEIAVLKPKLALDLALKDNAVTALENAHTAAFRSGLGNSLYIPNHRLGKVSVQQLQDFVAQTHGTAGMAVVGLGVEHDLLVKFAKNLGVASVKAASQSTYKGSELRTENGSSVAHVVVCGQGSSVDGQDMLALAVAQYALGVGSTVAYGANSSSPLAVAVNNAGGAGVASALNVNYSDAGLFGYTVIADADAAGAVVSAVHKAVKTINLTDKDVANAKYKLKAAIFMSADSQEKTLEDMGLQALTLGSYTTPSDFAAKVDGVTVSSVNAAIKRAFSGKLTMGAAGGLHTVPYIDEL